MLLMKSDHSHSPRASPSFFPSRNNNSRCQSFAIRYGWSSNNCCNRLNSETIAKRRSRSNRKERKRNEEMNLAFAKLQQCVPHIPKDQKLPKIKTLRLAVRYIQHLEDILRGETTFQSSISATPRPLELEDFASVAMQEVQTRNNYKDRAEQEMGISRETNGRHKTDHGLSVDNCCSRFHAQMVDSHLQRLRVAELPTLL